MSTLLVAAGLTATAVSSQAQSATATISDTPVAGGFDYTITLKNTGSSTLGSFWYGWTQVGNNLPSDPTGAGNSLGWANDLDSNSIQWINPGANFLFPGASATFTFFDTSTPAAITTSPSGESVAYEGNSIDFSQFAIEDTTLRQASSVFSPVLVATPEPSSIALLGIGSLGLLALAARRSQVPCSNNGFSLSEARKADGNSRPPFLFPFQGRVLQPFFNCSTP